MRVGEGVGDVWVLDRGLSRYRARRCKGSVGEEADCLGHGRLEEAAVWRVGETVTRQGVAYVEEEGGEPVACVLAFTNEQKDEVQLTCSERQDRDLQETSECSLATSDMSMAMRPRQADHPFWQSVSIIHGQ